MLAVIDTVAADLGNTRAVCRSSYIRPLFMDDWVNEVFVERWNDSEKEDNIRGKKMLPDEITAIEYMKKWEHQEFKFTKN